MDPLYAVIALLGLFNLIELVAILCLVVPLHELEPTERENPK